MNPPQRLTVYDIVNYFGLTVEYVADLPDKVFGQLDSRPEPVYIAVKPNLPKCEEVFTIAHELGHFALHPSFRPRSDILKRHFRHSWKYPLTGKLAAAHYRICRRHMNLEWQADLWAMCLLLRLGDSANLNAYVKLHPEKSMLFFLAAFTSFYKAMPQILLYRFRWLLTPFVRVAKYFYHRAKSQLGSNFASF